MGRECKSKVWAFIIMTVTVLSAFGGISGLAKDHDIIAADLTPVSFDDIRAEFNEVDAKQPVNNNLLNRKIVSLDNSGILPLSQPPGNEIKGTWTYDFDSDTVGQLPSDPPWEYVGEPAGQPSTFGADDFEDDIVGEKPDDPPWTTVDGSGPVFYWMEDFESYTLGQDLTPIYGGTPPLTFTAETPPPGAPAGTVLPSLDTGTLSGLLVENGGSGYWGLADIGGATTNQGYCGGWIYFNAMVGLRFDLLLIDMATMGTAAEIALWNDNNIYHWPGGVYTQIPGITWTVGTWHELFIQYYEVLDSYSVWWDGVEHVAGSAFLAPATDINAMVWFGDGTFDGYYDNICHMWPTTGLLDRVTVVDTQAHSGSQSVFLDQNNEAAPEVASMTADFDPAVAGNGTWDYWFRTDTTILHTHGALAELLDHSGNGAIQIRAYAGDFEYNDGGAWTAAQSFIASTWYHLTIDFDTVTKSYDLYIGGIYQGTGAFARESGTLVQVRYSGTPGTESEHFIDDVYVTCNGASADISVSDFAYHSAPNSLRFQEYNAGVSGHIGGDGFDAGRGEVGTFSFWFYNTDNGGGQMWCLMVGNATMTVISLGVDMAWPGANPGQVQFLNNDGTFLWAVDGPTYNINEWHNITIEYNCTDMSVSGFTGSYYYRWDGGPPVGPFGMMDPVDHLDMIICWGGAPETYGDFLYDDFYLYSNEDAPIVNLTSPDGGEVWMGGSSKNIWWNMSDNLDNITDLTADLYYSTDGGLTYPNTIATGLTGFTANPCSYNWNPVPSIDSTTVRVKVNVTDTNRLTASDNSTGNFTIDSTPPDPATNPHAELTYSAFDDVTIYWDLSADDGGGFNDVDHYEIWFITNNWHPTGDTYAWLDLAVIPPGTTSYVHVNRGAENGFSYCYQLRTYDLAGHETRTLIQAAKFGRTLQIAQGDWWALGSNLVQSNTSIFHVIQGLGFPANWDYAMAWDAINQKWLYYNKNWPPSLNTLFNITNDMGFWLHILASSRFCTAGYIEDMSISCYAGWNLVPYPYAARGMNTDDIELDLIANCPSYVPGSLTICDNSQPYYIRSAASDTISNNEVGFWIQVSSDTIWTVINY